MSETVVSDDFLALRWLTGDDFTIDACMCLRSVDLLGNVVLEMWENGGFWSVYILRGEWGPCGARERDRCDVDLRGQQSKGERRVDS